MVKVQPKETENYKVALALRALKPFSVVLESFRVLNIYSERCHLLFPCI